MAQLDMRVFMFTDRIFVFWAPRHFKLEKSLNFKGVPIYLGPRGNCKTKIHCEYCVVCLQAPGLLHPCQWLSRFTQLWSLSRRGIIFFKLLCPWSNHKLGYIWGILLARTQFTILCLNHFCQHVKQNRKSISKSSAYPNWKFAAYQLPMLCLIHKMDFGRVLRQWLWIYLSEEGNSRFSRMAAKKIP